MKYDIIIPTSERDIDFLHWVIKFIRQNLPEAYLIYIITKENVLHDCKTINNNIIFINEDKLIDSLSFNNVKNYLKEKGYEVERTGWYFQQFLKMAFAQSDYCRDYYLSWDSDTIPLSHITFFEGDNPMFTLKKEFHKPYFDTINRLIGKNKAKQESFIAEHMMFNKNVMIDLLEVISLKDISKKWWQIIIDNIEVTGEGNYFSEFETYGTFAVTKYPELYHFQKLNTFRSAGLIRGRFINENLIERLSIDLDIASFEIQDERFPYNFEKIRYKVIRKIHKLLGK